MTLKFVPHDGPQTDYFITTQDNENIRGLMTRLGAVAREKKNYTAYIWNERLNDTFISGAGVLDSKFFLGPRPLPRFPQNFGAGTYNVVHLLEDGARVVPDPFGILPVYYSQSFVTNRLHLAALVQKELDARNSMSVTYDYSGFSFQFNTLNLPVAGVNLLESGHVAIVDGKKVSTLQYHLDDSFQELSQEEYWKLIEQGAEELVSDVSALIDADYPVYADITGGKDSRLVFGAVVAAGKQKEVVFNTIPFPTSEGLQKDLEIATGLVARYGGNYSGRPSVAGYSVHAPEENILKRRSQVFGSYHWIVPSDISPLKTLTKTPTIRIMGGGGEVYRDRWHYLLFTKIDLDAPATEENILRMLTTHQPAGPSAQIAHDYFEVYRQDLLETFNRLPGDTLGHKIDSHFLSFRNRYHFGQKQSMPESMFGISIANSPSLLAAYRGLPAAERAAGRVPYDVMRTFDDKLPHYPFDKPLNPEIFSSHYHKKSMVESLDLALVPQPELAQKATSNLLGVERPIRPAVPDFDFESVLNQEIEEAKNILLNSSTAYDFMKAEELENLITWSCERSIAQKSAIASKLRFFADLSVITQS